MPKKNFDKIVDSNPALAFMSSRESMQGADNSQGKDSIAPEYDNIIAIELLIPFANHPFKLYEGDRFSDMVRSIKEMGILLPIIVRPVDSENEQYEILSGHNRVNAAKAAGLTEVPVIIKRGLSDDEAKLIVTETNLVQRGFADLLYSERATALKNHMDAIKHQGKRVDLINEINELLNDDKIAENDSLGSIAQSAESQVNDSLGNFAQSANSREITAKKYGLSPRNISNYIRLCKLNSALLNKVDNETIAFIPAILISYLSPDEQTELNSVLDKNNYKVDIKKAELLRSYSENKKLTNDKILQILSGELNKKPKTTKSPAVFKLKYKIYSKYFDETMDHEEAESIIDKALAKYFEK